ncbi:hypothetical protein [Myxosarcina sp. GI1]|uniref:hypothetical protein n=1 Tax=Myxosarcina sp. GI1 TaxID=1541065 RepID=UPI00055F7C62|nr:hypothetical protein [Myxosarcina sp. GI1]
MRKLARFEFVRQISRYFHSNIKTASQNTLESPSLFKELNVARVVTCLKTEGCFLGLQLPEGILQELLDFAARNYCYGNRNLQHPLLVDPKKTFPRKYRLASYLDTHLKCDAFQRLKNDPILLEIARQYFKKPAVYLTSELCWSFPNQSSYSQMIQDAQVFHYDIDDYQSLKFFFYLTDVDLSSGAHICILKSHKNKRLWHQLIGQHTASIPDSELIKAYGEENVIQICGEKGFGFVEDTFCFHKGTMPTQKSRLLLQLEFTTNYYQEPRAYM